MRAASPAPRPSRKVKPRGSLPIPQAGRGKLLLRAALPECRISGGRAPTPSSSSVQPARHELDWLDVQHVMPIRFVSENLLEHRLSLKGRGEELDDLLDLVGDDGVEDHQPTLRVPRCYAFGLLGEFACLLVQVHTRRRVECLIER